MREVPRNRSPLVEELEERVRGQLALYISEVAGDWNDAALDTLEAGDTTITVDLSEALAEERRRRKDGRIDQLEKEMDRLKAELGSYKSNAALDQQREDRRQTLELRRDR